MKWLVTVFLWISVATCQFSQSLRRREDVVNSEYPQCSYDSQCPTWFICDSNESICKCGNDHNLAIACDDKELTSAVLDCHCVTYDEQTESTFLGLCFYNCGNHFFGTQRDSVYVKLQARPELLINNSFCTQFRRTGLLCGDCEDGYSPLVLSYSLSCVECPDGHENWWKFIVVAFVPLTFFYFFVVVFNINVTSSRLHGVVWFSQVLSTPEVVRSIMVSVNPKALIAAKVFVSFYSYWNLDILRIVLPNVCLNVSTLQALAMDYLVALYPYVLILFSYFTIELYDRKCPCVVVMWKPFHKVLSLFRKKWHFRTSVIDSFATFFFLSYIKIISVSTDILMPTYIYQLSSDNYTLGVYYTPTVDYFGQEHLPYAVLAITLLVLFVLIPILSLLFYPFQLFQKFLSVLPFNWHFLRAFVDSYQGCFKDGTEPGTFDCRWFSTLTLLLQPIAFIIYGLAKSMMFFAYAIVILAICVIILINIQPFKKTASRFHSTDTTFYILLCLCFNAVLGNGMESRQSSFYHFIMFILAMFSAFVPIAYILSLIGFWLFSVFVCRKSR